MKRLTADEHDPRIQTSSLTYPSPKGSGTMRG